MAQIPPLPISLVLADDDGGDRFFFKKALEELAIPTNLTTLSDGQQLMDYFTKNPDNLPDVLFLDLNMPCKNGAECLAEIKQDEHLKHIPVVVYSTSLREEVADALYKMGAHYYMQKCDFNELAKSIEGVLALIAENPLQPSRDNFIPKPPEP